jgi:hypothetical protein
MEQNRHHSITEPLTVVSGSMIQKYSITEPFAVANVRATLHSC